MCSSDKAPEPICNPEWNAPDWNGGADPRLASPRVRGWREGWRRHRAASRPNHHSLPVEYNL